MGSLDYTTITHDLEEVETIVKSSVWHDESSGDLIDCCHLNTVFEFDSGYHLGEIIETA